MRAVRYHEAAREEFLHEISYFTAISPRLARQFDEAVLKAELRAAGFAELGMPYRFGTRRVIPGKFKFSVVYVTRADEVFVLAVAPFSRRPGYWKARKSAA